MNSVLNFNKNNIFIYSATTQTVPPTRKLTNQKMQNITDNNRQAAPGKGK